MHQPDVEPVEGGGCALRGLVDRPPSIKPIDPSVCSCNMRTLGHIFCFDPATQEKKMH